MLGDAVPDIAVPKQRPTRSIVVNWITAPICHEIFLSSPRNQTVRSLWSRLHLLDILRAVIVVRSTVLSYSEMAPIKRNVRPESVPSPCSVVVMDISKHCGVRGTCPYLPNVGCQAGSLRPDRTPHSWIPSPWTESPLLTAYWRASNQQLCHQTNSTVLVSGL